MSDDIGHQPEQGSSLFKNIALGVAALYVVFSLYFSYSLYTRIDALEAKQKGAEEALGKRLAAAQSEMKANADTLAEKVGMTQKELEERSSALQRQQRVTEKLTEQQKKQQEALGAVTGEVAGVKSDVGGVKSDVASTKSELEATKAKLERTIGDLGIQSGLIATTREDLELLKHRGDRNYYEFTLRKKQRTPISTVSFELKKTDPKKGKFTLNVLADDKTIEKKDRTMMEPMQFYTGRDRQLFEVVVFKVDRDTVTGYLATPKQGPPPAQ